MSNDPRDSTRKALFAYLDRTERERVKTQTRKPARRNEQPEKLVEKECVQWLEKNNFDGQVYESKAVLKGGEWRKSGMSYGHSDWMGASPYGELCAIEFKALGKRSTFWKSGNERQQDFILNKIESNCFAVVVDNSVDLDRWFHTWRARKQHDPIGSKQYLLDLLPKKPKRVTDNSPLFED